MSWELSHWVKRYADWVIRYRWLAILLTLFLVGAAAVGVKELRFSNNYRVFFSSDNPELVAFEDFQATYTKNDNLLFVIQPINGGVFTPDDGAVIEAFTEAAWQIPYTIRVDSISNFQHTWAQTVDGDDELIVEDLLRNSAERPAAWLEQRRRIALAEPLLKGNLISPDAATTGINVTLQYPEIDNMKEVPEAVAYARQLAEDVRAKHPDLVVAISGLSMLNNAFAESGQKDAATLVPTMYGILIFIMLISLRSVSGTIATVLVIGFSSLTAMGLAGHLGIKLTPISITAPTIVLTLAIADSIHLLVTMLTHMRDGQKKIDALKESIVINFLPVSITSLTTVIGFLALNFSDAPPFWHLGNITAMGITAAWLYSLLFLPAFVSLLPIKVKVKPRESAWSLNGILDQLALLVINNRNRVLMGMGVFALVLAAFVPTITLNDQFVRYFDHRLQFRNDTDFVVKHLNGIYQVEMSIPGAEPGGISEPTYLRHLEQLTTWLRAQPNVRHVYSYADIVKRLNRNMHSDDDAWYRIPKERELAAQYLLLYELSLPYGLDLNDRINVDKSATRVTATLDEVSTAEIRTFLAQSKQWLKENAPEYMWTQPTGASVMFSYISQRNIESMLRGNVLAIVLIAAVLIVSLRSVVLGTMSIIPNAVPVLMSFGVWALLVGQVGMAAATVTATSLGIVVDDTVHFLAKYLHARRAKSLDKPEAIRYAFRTVGSAIVVTTIILTIGFGVLAGSTFLLNAQMGLLTALTIVFALVFDFFMLPALLLLGRHSEKVVATETAHEASPS